MTTKRKKHIKYDDSYDESSDQEYIPDYDDSDLYNLKRKNKNAYNNFIETKLEITKTEPNIILILEQPLLKQDRALLLQLYEMYKSSPSLSEEWFNLRNKVNKVFDESKNNFIQYSKYTEKQHSEMEKQFIVLDQYDNDIDLQYKIIQLNTNIENKQVIYSRYKELKQMTSNDDEKAKLKHWIKWAITIPYDNIKVFPFSKDKFTLFLKNVYNTLEKELYGMKIVKEQILLFISSKIKNPHMKKCSLGLIGAPGTGKTAISRMIAKVLDFPFEQISLGGISNPDFLKGHEYTYIGAQPGEIVKCLNRMKNKNGILFFDEFDKISDNKDLCSALLHITDPVQNSDFRDKFLSDITIDLSYLWFIYSMNDFPIDSALKDRIYTIEVPGYKFEDKVCIIIDYLFPKALENINIPINSILIGKKIAELIIKKTKDWENCTGIRPIEQLVNNIVSKIDFLVNHQDDKGKIKGIDVSFNTEKIIRYPLTLTSEIIERLV